MSGLKEQDPKFAFSGGQVQPSDLDQYTQYDIVHPGLGTATIGTSASAATVALTLINIRPDYPRTLLFTLAGVAGGMGGSATITGVDQFGQPASETIGFGSAAGGGSVATSNIYARVTSAVVGTINGLNGTAVGTASLGYAIGTAVGLVAKFGLPTKIGGTADVKSITYTSQGVGGTALNGGTIDSTLVDTTKHALIPNRILAGTEHYIVLYKPSFDNSGKANLALL